MSLLRKFVEKGALTELEEQGLIKSFEYTYELAWNVMKDYYEFQGMSDIQGSRDAIRLAFRRGLITDGEAWMNMIDSRVQTSHTYNESIAREISTSITKTYIGLFIAFEHKMNSLKQSGQQD